MSDAQWTKARAIRRMQQNKRLAKILLIEPRLKDMITEAEVLENYPGYHRIETYYQLRDRAKTLVGFDAPNPELRTMEAYDAVIGTIDDLLPPDDVDLWPDGKPEEVE